jgi:hypothetical protein
MDSSLVLEMRRSAASEATEHDPDAHWAIPALQRLQALPPPASAWWETRTTSRRRRYASRNASCRLHRGTKPTAWRCGSGSTTAGPCATSTGAGTEALEDARERRMSARRGQMH